MGGPAKRMIVVLIFLVVGGQLLLWSMERYDPVEDTRARAQTRLGFGDISTALDVMHHLTERYPERADAWAALAEVDAQVGGFSCAAEAQTALAKAEARTDTAEHLRFVHRIQGLILLIAGDAHQGRAALESAGAGGDAVATRTLALLALHDGRSDAGSRLRVVADAEPSDDALAAAISSADPTHADEAARADPPENADPGGWNLLEHARLAVALGQDHHAAALLMRAHLHLGNGRLQEQVPLTKRDLLADPVFAHAGAETTAVITGWPEQAPWKDYFATPTTAPSTTPASTPTIAPSLAPTRR